MVQLRYTSTHPTELKIIQFRELEDRWHYGQGVRFTDEVINTSLRLHRSLVMAGYSDTDAFPGVNGEVQVSVYDLPRSCEITIKKDGQWLIVFEDDGKEGWESSGPDAPGSIPIIIGMINATWSTFISYLESTGTESLRDSPVLHLNLPMMEGFPLLTFSVSQLPEGRSVSISESIIPVLPENRLSSGGFQTTFYQTPYLSFRR